MTNNLINWNLCLYSLLLLVNSIEKKRVSACKMNLCSSVIGCVYSSADRLRRWITGKRVHHIDWFDYAVRTKRRVVLVMNNFVLCPRKLPCPWRENERTRGREFKFQPIMADYDWKKCLSGVILVLCALISDNGVRTDVNFKSKPTTIKTFENDTVLLPCYSTGKRKQKSWREFLKFSYSCPL